jgi:Na+-transporting methylmalonyl-CoA/oxaloacetate decarboxylase gamma subunit
MSLGMVIILGIILVALVVGLFAMMTNPQEVSEEEKEDVEKEVAAGISQHHTGTLE